MAKQSDTKPPKRKRGLTGIRPVFSRNRWRWRAVCTIGGRRLVGALRDTQSDAHLDYLKLKEGGRAAPAAVVTLEEGFAAVIAHKRAQGTSSERTLNCHRRNVATIMQAWEPSAPLAQIATAEELNYYVSAALASGRSPNTIGGKDLPLLRLAFRLAGIEWPEGVRRVRPRRPQMAFFEPDEATELVRRIRSARIVSSQGRVYETGDRVRDAALIEFMICTGLRAGEVGRLKVGDFDMKRLVVRVTNHKDNNSVADVRFPREIVDSVRTLLGDKPAGSLVLDGGERELSAILRRWKHRLGEPRLNGRALRHTHITMALYDTGDPAVARDAGRHTSLKTTGRYIHAISRRHDDRVAALGARFAPPREPSDPTDESSQ